MQEYNPNEIEKRWQEFWDDDKTFKTELDTDKKKFYPLVEFPYPSGQGLHVGHARPYTMLDIVARKRRMEGENVLFTMGWDAFGLPTENYAIKEKIHPAIVTENNVANFKRQLKSLGYSFDWDREINTTDPNYFKWTQWIFLQLYKHGLAYKAEMPINWCTSCKVGLANEEVVNGKCERCGSEVVHKVRSQWMLKITEYAQRLIDDLDGLDYIEPVKIQQKNWISRSEGAQIDFAIEDSEDVLTVFTTRPDTIFGSTYMVLAPEHPYVEKYKDRIENYDEILAYLEEVEKKSEFERAELDKEKTGVPLKGLHALHPVTKEPIPLWISDYVLMGYGTGAIMAVPGHDIRDYEFAKKFNLPIISILEGVDVSEEAYPGKDRVLANSQFLDGLTIEDAIIRMNEWIEEEGIGKKTINYKLRDWVFSRQRYWGEPIPIVHCEKCGHVPLPEEELPLTLPDIDYYEPTDDGQSPLSQVTEWVETTCPKCHGHAHRETDTMPQWAGSSWYFLRYTDPHNDEALAGEEEMNYFMPVDWYNGGMEHTTLHLLYSRFWYKFLYDIGVVSTKEPYVKRTSHGMILGESGAKMSKSRGNVVNPDDIVNTYGADTLRTYEMFIGDFEKSVPWSENGVKGCRRFLEKVWNIQEILGEGEEYSKELETLIHQTIKKVSHDYENLKANTAIAQLMTLLNEMSKLDTITRKDLEAFLILLNPVAPHITEEIWVLNNFSGYVHDQKWPNYDEAKTIVDEIEIPVQFNGKVRFKVVGSRDMSEEEVKEMIHNDEAFSNNVAGKTVVKEIYIPGKIYNIVIK